MYRVTCDGKPLLQMELEEYRLYNAKWHPEVNKAGSFTFTMYPGHPNYGIIQRMKSNIRVYYKDTLVFSGRPLDDDAGFYNQDKFLCEGDLAILNDSIQRPFRFPQDDDHTTPEDLFRFLIRRHNEQMPPEKQFTVGRVTVTDANNYISRSDTEYSTTWELVKSQLLDTVGGYVVLRIEGDTKYLDYLEDFEELSSQPIQFGENLLDILTSRKGSEIATAILPLGKQDEETEERVTIESLADSETDDICKQGDIVFSKQAEDKYGGRIIKRVLWDDVTIPANLLRKSVKELETRRRVVTEQKLTAADMSAAGYEVEPFLVGRYVYAKSAPHQSTHDLQPYFLIKAMDIDLMNPAQNTVTVGSTTSTFTETSLARLDKAVGALTVSDKRTAAAVAAVQGQVDQVGERVDQTNETVAEVERHVSQVTDDVAKANEAVAGVKDRLGRIDSEIELTNEAVTNYYAYSQGVNSRVADMEAYIRTGHVLDDPSGSPIFGVRIGQQDLTSAFMSVFTATMLGFYEGSDLIAFFSNKKENVETIRTANLELTDDLTDPESVDWLITLANGFTLKWVGE